MGEHSVAQARASVMLYNNEMKKWENAGSSHGISRVHVYFNPNNDSYRIVGRKINDNEVVINCIIAKNLKYNKATATFHQWRDQRQVYGLNFQTPDDAVCFSEAVLGAVEDLIKPPPAQPPQQDSAPQYNSHDGHGGGTQFQRFQPQQHSEPQRLQQPASQPVSRVQEPPKASPPSSVPQPPPVPQIVSSVPPSTPAPPPPGPPAPPGGGGPPAPPPPPPVGGSEPPAPPAPPVSGGGNLSGGGGLASALAGVQLKKRSAETEDRQPPSVAANPIDDMMSALNKKLQARKKMSQSPGSGASATVENDRPSPAVVTKSVAPPLANKAPTSTPFNKSNFGAKKTNEMVRAISNANSTSPVSNSTKLSADELKSLKQEIMSCVKEEIQAAKNEILQALRQEIQRLSTR